jgi:hypothetical protein
VIGWAGINNVRAAYLESVRPEPLKYIDSYGPTDTPVLLSKETPHHLLGNKSSKVIVNGSLLGRFADKYNLVSIAFHWNGSQDYKDAPNIAKSGPLISTLERLR